MVQSTSSSGGATARFPIAYQSRKDGTTPCACSARERKSSTVRGNFRWRSPRVEPLFCHRGEDLKTHMIPCWPLLSDRRGSPLRQMNNLRIIYKDLFKRLPVDYVAPSGLLDGRELSAVALGDSKLTPSRFRRGMRI